jgi:hypothetical protein
MTVRCDSTDGVKKAYPYDDLYFPYIDSCIAIICYLNNDVRFAVHCDHFIGARGKIDNLKFQVGSQTVRLVQVFGNLYAWGYNFESQLELAEQHNKSLGINEKTNYKDAERLMSRYYLINHKEDAKRYIRGRFNCSNVELLDIHGNIRTTPNGIIKRA